MPIPSDHGGRRPDKAGSMVLNPATAFDLTYYPDEVEFMMAMERFMREYHRPHPTCRDILAVARSLGYRKID